MIVCLGWGSLIWSPRSLPNDGEWRGDGPRLPIEFARVASDQRLTLVIHENSPPVTVLWTRMTSSSLDEAVEALAVREGCSRESIGFWSEAHSSAHPKIREIENWAKDRELESVVWTALRPGFPGKRGTPITCREALDHLSGLEGNQRAVAEKYVRKAPVQTATPYRAEIERAFGWTPI
ncbi:MAG: hypothetical protein R3E09_12640 [Novosphingobium sp.]